MGHRRIALIILVVATVLVVAPTGIEATHNPNHGGGGGQNPCQGNPTPDPVSILNAELVGSNAVRLDFEHSQCATEYDIERSDNGGTFVRIVNIDRTFDIETFRPDSSTPVTFYLDEAVTEGDQVDYRILAKTQTREATSYSPVVTENIPVGQTSLMVGSGLVVVSNTITPIPVSYIEGSTPLQNLLWEYFLDFDLISLFINWAFANHGSDLWTSDSDPQNQAQLFYIEPTPAPFGNSFCFPTLVIHFKNDQSGGQTIDYTITLLDYPTIIHQESFNSGMANRIHVQTFELTQAEEAIITDYSNIYVQINAQGETGLPPPNDRSLIIHDLIFYVPEDQGACFS